MRDIFTEFVEIMKTPDKDVVNVRIAALLQERPNSVTVRIASLESRFVGLKDKPEDPLTIRDWITELMDLLEDNPDNVYLWYLTTLVTSTVVKDVEATNDALSQAKHIHAKLGDLLADLEAKIRHMSFK